MSKPPRRSCDGRTVKAVQLSCDILDALRALDGAGVTEVANHVGVSKGAVHTHLATLKANELVVNHDGEYQLSLRFIDLGEYIRDQIGISNIVEEEIKKLAENSGEIAQFMVEEHGRGVYLAKAEGENAVQTLSYVGNRNPLHCTALGKAILAYTPEERVNEIVDRHGLPAKTSNTITERDKLFDELERVRERALAFDRGEIFKGLQCVAAPVLDHDGEVIGAVSVTGPRSRMQDDHHEQEIAEMVRHTSNVIEVNAAQVQ
ncbi:putative HTH-type transcriptional regulator ArcR [Halalkalicoccus paucihalophilus]|uniref:Putative HTH-type transcriptional regulator ArcR n=1 Tax=Halalkalicoccus paucihalophilus TaxID=1008153 RepID=A0A151A9W5_9EURY|nr:IclR family transcriptional regulator [Halalkalicoccus paucihalophilus]KYH24425.1 putative HTH-type transcriptional regulator ArcR [Halalkalicoccus paucihalophilus]